MGCQVTEQTDYFPILSRNKFQPVFAQKYFDQVASRSNNLYGPHDCKFIRLTKSKTRAMMSNIKNKNRSKRNKVMTVKLNNRPLEFWTASKAN